MLEELMTQAGEALRARGWPVAMFTDAAVIDGPVDDSGKLPPNPDTGAGALPGDFTLVVSGVKFNEAACANLGTVESIVSMVERTLGEDE
jgi:hypothetical protein